VEHGIQQVRETGASATGKGRWATDIGAQGFYGGKPQGAQCNLENS